jgi:GT2 family glycosyltransferase
MIILDLRSKKYFSQVEKIKVILHLVKISFMYKLEVRIQNNKRVFSFIIWRKKLFKKTNFIIIMQPESRLIHRNLESLIRKSSTIIQPTVIICPLIYKHLNNQLHKIHLPKVSKLIINKINYINEVQIVAGFPTQKDVEQFVEFNHFNKDRIVEFKNNLKYENFDLPIKVLKKNHDFKQYGRNLFDNFEISDEKKFRENSNVSVIIPTTLNTVANNFKFSSLIDQVTNLLNSLQIKFEIILVIGPEVNRYELKELVKNFPEIIIVTNELLFNFSRRVNDGLAIAKHDLIWLLNDDIRIINHNSVKEDLLIAYCLAKKSTTGIVGTFLMEGNLINHAGMQINDEIADHILRGSQFSNLEAMNAFRVREVSGVTGANIFFLKKTIEELGNFDETFPLEFSDVELCLRANKNGLQNYVIRTKNFNHFESSTRDNSLDPSHQILRALTKYEIEYKEDPYKFTVPYCCLKQMSETNQ